MLEGDSDKTVAYLVEAVAILSNAITLTEHVWMVVILATKDSIVRKVVLFRSWKKNIYHASINLMFCLYKITWNKSFRWPIFLYCLCFQNATKITLGEIVLTNAMRIVKSAKKRLVHVTTAANLDGKDFIVKKVFLVVLV